MGYLPAFIYFSPDLKLLKIQVLILLMGNISAFHKSKVLIQLLIKKMFTAGARECWGLAQETMTGVAQGYLITCSLQCRHTLNYKREFLGCAEQFAENTAKE